MRFSECNVRTKSGERSAAVRRWREMALQLKGDDSKALLPSPESPLSSSMPSCVRGSVTIHLRQWACSRVASRSHAFSVCAGCEKALLALDNQATPHFAWSPFFRETFFREMLLRDVSRKFFVAKVFSYTVNIGGNYMIV